MNQRGDVTLVAALLLFALTGLVLLAALELQRSFRLLERRTRLFLCIREVNGELADLLRVTGRANWGIRNAQRASTLAVLIPGLQGAAGSAQKVKIFLQRLQDVKIAAFLAGLGGLRGRGCPLDPRLFATPFEFPRDREGALRLKEQKWTYGFISRPYFLSVETRIQNWEAVTPRLGLRSSENRARFFSPWSSSY